MAKFIVSPKLLRLKPRLTPIISLPSSHFFHSHFPKPTSYSSIASLPQTLPTSYSLPPKPVSPLNTAATFNNVILDPRHLSCCMPDKRLKVAVLLSGGVDSSVALRLLHAAGHSCTAFYLKIWFQVNPFHTFLHFLWLGFRDVSVHNLDCWWLTLFCIEKKQVYNQADKFVYVCLSILGLGKRLSFGTVLN